MLTAVTVFLLSLIALLAVPVTLDFQVSWRQILQSKIELHWAFGLVRFRVSSLQSKAPSPQGADTEQTTGHPKRSSGRKRNFIAVVRQDGFRRRIVRFIRDLWHAVKKENVILRIRIGLGDPADTGQLWAVLGPVSGILANVREATIEIEPEFLDTTFELDSRGSVRIIPLQMIFLTMALLLSPPVWQGIYSMRAVEQ